MVGMTDNAPPGPVEWTTIRQAAAMAGVSTKTIRRALKAKKLVAQRGDEQNDPWQIRTDSVTALYGTPGKPRRPTPTPNTVDSTLAPQIETLAQLLNEALKAEGDARERAARAEAEVEHLRERLAEARTVPLSEDAVTQTKRRRRWWPGRNR
jgi:hypothetical protein